MRWAVLLFLVACDLQPPKGDKSPPPRPAGGVPADAAAAPTPNPTNPTPPPVPDSARMDAGVAKLDAMETTDACTEVAVHIADVVIASLEDPTIKAQQEQDRTRLVKRVAETCTRDKWSAEALKCFRDGKTAPELEVCGRNLAAPKPQ